MDVNSITWSFVTQDGSNLNAFKPWLTFVHDAANFGITQFFASVFDNLTHYYIIYFTQQSFKSLKSSTVFNFKSNTSFCNPASDIQRVLAR